MDDAWQLIETAPRDGTSVLLFMPRQSGDFIATGEWSSAHGGWVETWGHRSWGQPTHWMPEPEPPQ